MGCLDKEELTTEEAATWYADGAGIEEKERTAVCKEFFAHLLIVPTSKAIENALTMLEGSKDVEEQATCLADAMEVLALHPDFIIERQGIGHYGKDFTSTHGFKHKEDTITAALGITDKEEKQMEEAGKVFIEDYARAFHGPFNPEIRAAMVKPFLVKFLRRKDLSLLAKAAVFVQTFRSALMAYATVGPAIEAVMSRA